MTRPALTAIRSAARELRRVAACGAVVLISHCAPDYTLITTGADPVKAAQARETFGYRKWLAPETEPEVVIIGLHGFCGASIDYENLGHHMMQHQPATAVYAYEIRGQGNDPLRSRRGDIDDPSNWFQDLEFFTAKVRKEHPHARIIWFGESMGSLIIAHTWQRHIHDKRPPCDGIIFSSPVVKVRSDFPRWKIALLESIAIPFPGARLSVDSLSSGQKVQMTHDSCHSQQAETNSWNIDRHTLRLLATIGRMVDDMESLAPSFHVPVLVMHGGRDFFTAPRDVVEFCNALPASTPKHRAYFPNSYHLLMYDTQKERVFREVEHWISATTRAR